MAKYPAPLFEFVNEKAEDGTYSVAIVMSKIPNKRLADQSLKWMKEAMNDHITKLMGSIAMAALDEKHREEIQ